MGFQRGIDGPAPVDPEPIGVPAGPQEWRRATRSGVLGIGTLACPECDAPVAPLPGVMGPADPLGCGFCDHAGAVRDFLSLAEPSRPARVVVRLSHRVPR